MSTSDQQGNQPLTRKQLREIRLTGATPVITEDEAAAAAATPPATPPVTTPVAPAEPIPAPRSDDDVDLDEMPLTRRQVREQERIRTASVPVIGTEGESTEQDVSEEDVPEVEATEDEIVSGIPDFAPAAPADEFVDVSQDDLADDDLADDDLENAVIEVEPVSAAAASDATGDALVDVDETAEAAGAAATDDEVVEDEVIALGLAAEDDDEDDDDDVRAGEDPIATGERPVVNSLFGKGLLDERADVPAFTPSFDELITSDSGGSQHLAPNTLIFTPSSREGSLSGPVASTGELLITGSYDLPRGMGSQGHAHGTADGKEADAVLIDGELPASSSPTPIAASSAISTTKPAGEVIRPPAPEKGNKLMLSLAIMAGGLALALAVVLIVAFTTGLF